jgi:carboxypeptidase C (cathepsin A)
VASNFGVFGPLPNRPISEATGDAVRQDGLTNIEYLLDNNVKVAFVFGDRDYRCPWTGGEATGLAAKWDHQQDFANAGYEEIQGVTKQGTDHGGLVKQYDRFSFSRVFDSGHAVRTSGV